MRKKLLSSILACSMVLTFIPTAFAATEWQAVKAFDDDTTIIDSKKASELGSIEVSGGLTSSNTYKYTLTGTLKYNTGMSTYAGGTTEYETGHYVTFDLPVPSDMNTRTDYVTYRQGVECLAGFNVRTYKHAIQANDASKEEYKGLWDSLNDTGMVFRYESIDSSDKVVTLTTNYTTLTNQETFMVVEIDCSQLKLELLTDTVNVASSTGEVSGIANTGSRYTSYYFVTDAAVNLTTTKLDSTMSIADVRTKLGVTEAGSGADFKLNTDHSGKYLTVVTIDNNSNKVVGLGQTSSNAALDVTNAKKNELTISYKNTEVNGVTVTSGASDNAVGSSVTVTNGKADIENSSSNKYIKVVAVAQTGYSVAKIVVTNASGKEIKVVENANEVVFEMTNEDVTVTVTGVEKEAFSIKTGNAEKVTLSDEKDGKIAVSGKLTYTSNKWTLPLSVSMNEAGYDTSSITIVPTVDGEEKTSVAYSDSFKTGSLSIDFTTPAKEVKLVVNGAGKTIKTWTLDLTDVSFIKTNATTVVIGTDTATGTVDNSTVDALLGDTPEVVINAKTSSGSADTAKITLSSSAIDSINADEDVETVTVATDVGEVELNTKVIEELSGHGDVTLLVESNENAATLIGGEQGNVLNVKFLKEDGTEVPIDNKEFKITITYNFGVKKSILDAMGNVTIGYKSADGKTGVVNSVNNITEDGEITFETSHLTMFYITEGKSNNSTGNIYGYPYIPGVNTNIPGSTTTTPGNTESKVDEKVDHSISHEEALAAVEKFNDVNENNWYYKEVLSAVEMGIIKGTSKTSFAPNNNMTLLQTLTVLARFDGKDVDGESWAKDALAWAIETGMIEDAEDESDITRERLVYLLYKYAESQKVDVEVAGDLDAFPDAKEVSDEYVEAMTWAVEMGIIKGDNVNGEDMLAPTATTTRAQVVTVLTRYADIIA